MAYQAMSPEEREAHDAKRREEFKAMSASISSRLNPCGPGCIEPPPDPTRALSFWD
jgi:hypothetical protein